MIVKILYDKGAVVYDSFEKVSYKHYSAEEIKKFNVDAFWAEDCNKGNAYQILIIGKKKNGEEFSIASPNVVYLLNDEGKTIERLN